MRVNWYKIKPNFAKQPKPIQLASYVLLRELGVTCIFPIMFYLHSTEKGAWQAEVIA